SEVVLRARIKTLPGKQWAVKRAYSAIVKRLFDERDIEIPFPHQTLYFGVGKDGKAPPLHMIRDDSEDAEAETLPSEQTPPAPARKRRQQGKQIEGKDMPDIAAGPGEDDDR